MTTATQTWRSPGPSDRLPRRLLTAVLSLFLAMACEPMGEAATPGAERLTTDSGQELSPSLSPDGAIVYHRLIAPGNADIYLVRGDGPPVNLTANSPANDFEPAFSPGGESIAFRSARDGGGIFVMSTSGADVRRVTGEGFNPSWSSDGREIVYGMISAAASPYGAAVGVNGLRAVDVATGASRVVYAGNAFQPRVSPNGARIAFWHYGDPGAQRDIWTVRSDGSDTVRITNDEAVDWSPAWSADGAWLYFASDRDGAMKVWRVAIDQTSGVTSGEPELVSQDGGAQVRGHLSLGSDGTLVYMDATITRSLHRLSLDPATATAQGSAAPLLGTGLNPANDFGVSPDGEWIALRTSDRREDLYVIRSDGSGLRQLTDDSYRDRGTLAWTTDGRIIFRSDRPVNGTPTYAWYHIAPDGTGMQMYEIGGPATARWSPDDSKVAFLAAGLVVANGDGSDQRVVATTTGTLAAPVWSPDGRRIAYRENRGSDGTAYILDVTRADATPEPLEGMNFLPLDWSHDGNAIAGNRVFGDRPALAAIYDLTTRRFEELTETGSGPQWLANGQQLLVLRDQNTIQVVDRATKAVRDLVTVSAPNTLVLALSADNTALFYLESEIQGDVYRMRAP